MAKSKVPAAFIPFKKGKKKPVTPLKKGKGKAATAKIQAKY